MAPLLGVGLFIAIGHWLQEREARQQAVGAQKCDATWQLATLKQERDNARNEIARQRELMESERKGNQELANELQAVRAQYAEHKAAASSDPRCLSDGVLDAIRKHGGLR
jgi:chromosome segregation ATPase